MMDNQSTEYDVIIVGAGLAGLAAAKALHEQGKSYVILEATDRAGGKVCSKISEDTSRYFELGAQFVNKDMTEIVKLIKEAGMDLSKTQIPENLVVISEKSKEPIDLDFKDITDALGAVVDGYFNEDPLEKILDKHIDTKRKRQLMKSFVAAETTVSSQHINAKGLEELVSRITTTSNALNYQASGPLSHVIRYLETISKERIHYLEPVVKVKKTKTGFTLKTKNKSKYHAKAVIMAIPPTAGTRITFSSDLLNHYDRYLNSYIDGSVIKMTFVYDTPFWRAKKINGKNRPVYGVIYTANEGVNLVDSSKENGENHLTLFIGGDKATELSDVPAEVKEFFAKERLIEVFGEEAEDYKDYEISEWQQSPYYGGGYGAMVHADGEADAHKYLMKPYNNLVFASTELAPEFPQFMEGAVRSGQYAVKHLLREIK